MATRERKTLENVKHRKTYNNVDSVEQLLLVEVNDNIFAGYKQDLLVSPLNGVEKEFFVCHECKGLMRNACQIGEEQTPVCEGCVTEGASSHPMMRSRKMIPQLQAKCPLITRRCEWNGMICEVKEHLNVCLELVVNCENACDVILPRKELAEHLKLLCTKRIVDCEHCHFSLMYKDLSQHYDVCLELQLLCPNKCDVIVRRKQLNTHIDTDCPNTVVECPYRKFGCEQEMKRCELEDHKRVNEIVHLQSTTLFAVSKMEEMDLRIQQMGKKVIRMTKTLEQLCYPTVLRDFISNTVFRKSRFYLFMGPCFNVTWRFYNLRLKFYTTISSFVTIVMEYDTNRSPLAKWPFEGRFKLTFIDKIDIHKSLVYESAVVKLRPKHDSFAKAKDTYPDSLKLVEMPDGLFMKDKFLTENEISFILQIQEIEDILIMESMEK